MIFFGTSLAQRDVEWSCHDLLCSFKYFRVSVTCAVCTLKSVGVSGHIHRGMLPQAAGSSAVSAAQKLFFPRVIRQCQSDCKAGVGCYLS